MLLGIDLGGTKIEGVVMKNPHEVIECLRVATPVSDGYEGIVSTIVDVVRTLERRVGHTCSVGIGTPGSISSVTGCLKNSNTVCLNGKPLKEDLESRMQRSVRMANDANCFALAEAKAGAGRDHDVVFGVIIGTGVGGGLVVNGRALQGSHGIAGEWGHNVLVPDGRPCYCGKRGCVETYLSGSGLAQHYTARVGPHRMSAEEIAERARGGDSNAQGALDDYVAYFGQAMATVVNIVDPAIIVLGGGLSNIEMLYQRIPLVLEPLVFSDVWNTTVVKNELGDSSGVRGAACLWA